MMRSPILCSGAVSFGLHLAIIATLLSSGMLLDHKAPRPAVSYVDLRQLQTPEQPQKIDRPPSKPSSAKPQQKPPIIEPKPSRPVQPKSMARKLPVPVPATSPIKPPPEQKQINPKSSMVTAAINITPVAVAASPSQKRQPRPTPPADGNGRKEESSLIKTGGKPVAGSKTYTMGPTFLEAMPIVAENTPPVYPRSARRRSWEGEVLLLVQVDETGQVQEVQIDQSSDHSILDQAALAAVRSWHFYPARFNDQPVKAEVIVPIRFELQEP